MRGAEVSVSEESGDDDVDGVLDEEGGEGEEVGEGKCLRTRWGFAVFILGISKGVEDEGGGGGTGEDNRIGVGQVLERGADGEGDSLNLVLEMRERGELPCGMVISSRSMRLGVWGEFFCVSGLSSSLRSSSLRARSAEGSGKARGEGISAVCGSSSSTLASRRCIQVIVLGGETAFFSFHHLGVPRVKPSSRSFSVPGISCLYLHPVSVHLHSPVAIQCVQYTFLGMPGITLEV